MTLIPCCIALVFASGLTDPNAPIESIPVDLTISLSSAMYNATSQTPDSASSTGTTQEDPSEISLTNKTKTGPKKVVTDSQKFLGGTPLLRVFEPKGL